MLRKESRAWHVSGFDQRYPAIILCQHLFPLSRLIALVIVQSCDRLLRSLVNLLNKHFWLAQVWRMARAALFHLCFGARCEHLLVLRGSSLIVFADEIGGWNIAPGRASELSRLHLIRLRDQPRGP